MALSTQVRASTGSAFPWKYDVFLSFRGEDTRKGFTDHLYDKLQWRGIRTFRDDPELERGTAISPELLTAIEQSRFAVVVLSPNYASSTWCLLELSKICECMGERGTILPIFYEVDPSHVRHQRGSFAEAFDEHEEKLGEGNKEVEGWRDALTKVANLAGWTSKDYRYETELMKDVVQALWSKVHPTLTFSDSTEKLVGMDAKFGEIDVLLDKEANDVRFIGIWGMGGVGKTTLARVVYEKISHQFEVCIFLANVREVSATLGLVHLQKQILSQILKEENVQVWDVYDGMTRTKRCVCNKAVLLVLDDVDQPEQLKNLVGEKDWFGLRSRIIITTRNRHVLVTHGIEKPYELMELNYDEALQLFSLNAFRKYEPEEDYAELSECFVSYARGLPLALETLGSFLYKRSLGAWGSALEKLRNTPNRSVFDLLKVSYDGLDEMEKKIFLDIACFHRLYCNEFMIEQVYSSDPSYRITIDVLAEKSLITIYSDNQIGMHDLIQEMGCEIVRQESYEEPGGRSRLWHRNDIFHVFTKNTGTDAIEGILLDLPELEEADWNLEAFSKMCRLKLLYIDNLKLSLGPIYLPNALRFLKWSWYPSKSLPPGFQPDELTELSLVHSNIDHLWNGIKYLGKLKYINLSYSIDLRRTPDFTGIQNLEQLVLEGCVNLVKIHPSIAFLKRLKILNFRNCESIKCLPSKLEMESLETFDVSGCSNLKMIPEFVGKSLESLVLEGCTNLVDIHPSIAFLNRLKSLNLRNCRSIKSLPSEVEMESLETFDVSGCSRLKMIPEFVGQMKRLSKLSLSGTAVEKLPSSIERFSESLEELDLSGIVTREPPCSLFLKRNVNGKRPRSWYSLLPSGLFPRKSPLLASLKHLSSLKRLNLKDCNLSEGEIPNDIGSLSSLKYLNLGGNNFVSLPASIHLLSKLKWIHVENCKRLQQLPDLPLNEELYLRSDNCTSLEVLPDPPDLGRLSKFWLVCPNCTSTVGNQDSSYYLYSVLKRLLEETPCSLDFASFVIPGSEILEWFNNQSVGDSVTQRFPLYGCNSNWIGVAVCALLVPHDNPSAVREDPTLYPDESSIICRWRGYSFGMEGVGDSVKPIVSDHLFVVVLGGHVLKPKNCLEDTCNQQVKFDFEIRRAVGNNRCIKVKKCGARALYKHDMEELISKMNQTKSSVSRDKTLDFDFGKSAYEQGGVIVKGRREGTSGSGGSDDEYFSAEE
ncbi:putative winged helix-turn-helix DNA-binding domain, toll-like receptor [Rosa chinensis]|uniref:ADP-ribosyl cyclase/cyclic ADP-ribose hydrolase n=1 Tax=Rosa chinensis TaxID=74649 RepID=A0A2P6SK00_ROSCH|nr:disease resistance protein RUN1 [Rosa chinensis]PRQ59010.1 putative winged helix-turn-helix DNA-binding domain, toll-like receptor [Rosa chinensis]